MGKSAWRNALSSPLPNKKPVAGFSNKSGGKEMMQGGKAWNRTIKNETTKNPVTSLLGITKLPVCRLSTLPDEILEYILVRLSLVDINNLLAGADILTRAAIRRNIYNPEGKHEVRGSQLVALITQDNNLYERGHLLTVYKSFQNNLHAGCTGSVSSLLISGSTCLIAEDLLKVASPVAEIGLGIKKCPSLRSVEIHNSRTFSPVALLHRATKDKLTFGPTTFTMTGMQMRWGKHFQYGHGVPVAVAFLYAYGAKLWRHFPSVFSQSDVFGQWLSLNTMGMFLQTGTWKIIQHSYATQYVAAVCNADQYTDDGYDDESPVSEDPTGWKDMSRAGKEFAVKIAGPIFKQIGLYYDRNPARFGKDLLCHYCNQRLPEFCWQTPQLKLGEEGMCILCAYDRYESGIDEATLRPYKSSIRHASPELLPRWWQHETLGCRISPVPKKFMKFGETGITGDEGKSAQECNDMCKGCNAQLDNERQMKVGLCSSCPKNAAPKTNSKTGTPPKTNIRPKTNKIMSFREIRLAKREKAAKEQAAAETAFKESQASTAIPVDDDEAEEQLLATSSSTAVDEVITEDPVSTAMTEEDSAVEAVPELKHQTLATTAVPVVKDQTAGGPLILARTEERAIGQSNQDITKTDAILPYENAFVEAKIGTNGHMRQKLGPYNDNIKTVYLSVSGDSPATPMGSSLAMSNDKYKEFMVFFENSKKLEREGVVLCMYCRDRLEEEEEGACRVCLSLPVCHCCRDEVEGCNTKLCARCKTCKGYCNW